MVPYADERLAKVYADQLNGAITWMTAQPNFTTLEVDYAQLVFAPAAQASIVNQFIGGEMAESSMVAAIDVTLYRNQA